MVERVIGREDFYAALTAQRAMWKKYCEIEGVLGDLANTTIAKMVDDSVNSFTTLIFGANHADERIYDVIAGENEFTLVEAALDCGGSCAGCVFNCGAAPSTPASKTITYNEFYDYFVHRVC